MQRPTLIAVDATALDELRAEIARLHQRLDGVDMKQRTQWITVAEFADIIGRSTATVMRRVREGKLEVKHVAGVRMLRRP